MSEDPDEDDADEEDNHEGTGDDGDVCAKLEMGRVPGMKPEWS